MNPAAVWYIRSVFPLRGCAVPLGQLGINPVLEALVLPELDVATALILSINPGTDQLTVYSAPMLARCQLDSLLAQLAAPPRSVEIHGVDDDGSCQ
jgi:hypothetical protein